MPSDPGNATPDRAATLGDLIAGPLDRNGAVIHIDGVEIKRVGTYAIPGQTTLCDCTVGTPRTDYPHLCWKCGCKLR